jgi:hypothetical protein
MTEEEFISDPPKIYKGKLYKVRSIYGATLLGGPPAAAYIISHNFRVLGEKKKAIWTWVAMVAVILSSIFIPDELSSLNFIFAIASFVISVTVMNRFQEKQIMEYTDAGHIPYSNWRGVLIGFISIALISLVTFGIYYLATNIESDPKTEVYQNGNNTIHYYSEQMEEAQVKKLVDELYKYNFIKKEGQANFTILEENGEFLYYFPYTEPVWLNREYVDYYKAIKDSVQKDFPLDHIGFYICDFNYVVKLKL